MIIECTKNGETETYFEPRTPRPEIRTKEAEAEASWLHLRVTRQEKARWVRAANGRRMKLADWVREKLNAAGGQ